MRPPVIILLIIGIASAEDCKGCVSLDSYSFDKVSQFSYTYIFN